METQSNTGKVNRLNRNQKSTVIVLYLSVCRRYIRRPESHRKPDVDRQSADDGTGIHFNNITIA